MPKTPSVWCPACHEGSLIRYGRDQRTGKARWRCRACLRQTTKPAGNKTEDPGIDGERVEQRHKKLKGRARRKVHRYVITAAQNATWLSSHQAEFFESMQQYCNLNDAELIVIPFRYHNPTSLWSHAARENDWWDRRLVPYLINKRFEINKNLVVLADIKTQPTATRPLSGFDTITGQKSGILGHPKRELSTIPTPGQKLPKIMVSTGAVTGMNYTPTAAGKKGEHHHTIGAVVVESDGDIFHLRQITADDQGGFTDLTTCYTPDGARPAPPAAALIMGDTHCEFIDPLVDEATFGAGGIVERLRPELLVWHDLHDFYSRNHHHRNDPFIHYAKHKAGTDDVKKGLRETFDWFVARDKVVKSRHLIVPSNHPDALSRWIKETDWRQDPKNAELYLETALYMLRESAMVRQGVQIPDPFAYWARKMLPEDVLRRTHLIPRGESFQVFGIELGLHGDRGANGAKGSMLAFDRMGPKSVTGHVHSPFIRGGAWGVGVNGYLDMMYAIGGLSSWLQTDCVIYADGKRSLINIVFGEYTTL